MSRASCAVVLVAACAATSTGPASQPTVTTSDFEPVETGPLTTPQPATTSPPPSDGGAGPATASTGSGSAAVATPPPAPPEQQPIVFGLLDGELALEEAWERWRAGKTGSYDAVFEIAVLANRARPVAMSDELMVIALAKAVELSACDPDRLGRIRLLAIAVRTADHPPELTSELTRLADMGPVECGRDVPPAPR